MRLRVFLMIIFIITTFFMACKQILAFSFVFGDVGPPKENEVHIGKTAIVIPLNGIMLVKTSENKCAIKITKYWSENKSSVSSLFVEAGADEYATYESYYQDNGKNWILRKGQLTFPKLRGIGRFAFNFPNNKIVCGNITITWVGQGAICFNESCRNDGDDGLEFAPTPWTDMEQVNFYYPQIKWYKFDLKRVRENLLIDRVWRNDGDALNKGAREGTR